MSDSRVQLALVGGSGRSRSFAVVELTPGASEDMKTNGKDAMLEAIWPVIEEANSRLSDYTRLRREFIVLAGSERGLLRGPKGSILRGPSLKVFGADIDALFAGA